MSSIHSRDDEIELTRTDAPVDSRVVVILQDPLDLSRVQTSLGPILSSGASTHPHGTILLVDRPCRTGLTRIWPLDGGCAARATGCA